ncbi:MAG: 16S rRNA (cytidine(1402)-2'-O)-methyltransferase [Gammaproteobacteria bacterium]|nr:16S rRNA (cytidine(1402)-2'-O)-methyltransferase [Gammaproteobacteria bacterium]
MAAEQAAGGKRTSHQSEPAERGRGRLEVVATPIGNLADLSPRAREALADADLIAAEDTRRSGQLLSALGLQKPLISLHAHNERERGDALLARLRAGEVIALVSDAGTPLLSDPGFDLVQRAAAAGVEVRSVPGPTAIAAALSVAAVATDRFCFEGFLPAKPRDRRQRLELLRREPRTLVFFEAPHRIAAALQECAAVLGGTRQAAVARELTKLHESVYRGRLGELAQRAAQEPAFGRGEITLVIAGAAAEVVAEGDATPNAPIAADEVMERVLRAALAHLPAAKAAAIAAAASGLGREAAYARAVELAAARC